MVSYGVSEGGARVRGMQQTHEDQFFVYEYDNRGNFIREIPKSKLESFVWWRQHVAYDSDRKRILPLSDFEKQIGIRVERPVRWYKGTKYTEEEWEIFIKQFGVNRSGQVDIDYGELVTHYVADEPKDWTKIGGWRSFLQEKAEKKDLMVVDLTHLEFKKKHPYCVENNIHGTNCEQVIKKKLLMRVKCL